MTEDMLRAMEGPALTAYAVTQGLMDRARYYHPAESGAGRYIHPSRMEVFAPHHMLAHAREVCFDRLQSAQWHVRCVWTAHCVGIQGHIEAVQAGRQIFCTWGTGEGQEPSEAMALLRCVCLALCSTERDEP